MKARVRPGHGHGGACIDLGVQIRAKLGAHFGAYIRDPWTQILTDHRVLLKEYFTSMDRYYTTCPYKRSPKLCETPAALYLWSLPILR